jgi:hypothetical protein
MGFSPAHNKPYPIEFSRCEKPLEVFQKTLRFEKKTV